MNNRSRLLRRAHALAKKLDIDHETLSDFACVTFGADSMAELPDTDLIRLCNRLSQEVRKNNSLTATQRGEIYRLAYRELNWKSPDIKGFIKRQTGHYLSVQDLTREEATKVINGMRMIAAQPANINNRCRV